VIDWEQDRIRTVDDLFRQEPLKGWDPRTGTFKSRKRQLQIEFRAGDRKWYFDRRHILKVEAVGTPPSIASVGRRAIPTLVGAQLLAWRDYSPCADIWCDACRPCRDADGVGPLDREVEGVSDTIWFRYSRAFPYFIYARVHALGMHALLMRARMCPHPTDVVADLRADPRTCHQRAVRYAMIAEAR
jgi:hypothetical protein